MRDASVIPRLLSCMARSESGPNLASYKPRWGDRLTLRRSRSGDRTRGRSVRRWVLLESRARISHVGFVQLPTAGSGMNSRTS